MKYLYQRYDGKIIKYEQIGDNEYIDLKTGIITRTNDYVLLGKLSENIIDLIEVGDYVNGYEVLDKYLFNGEKPVLETNGEETNCKCLCNSDIKSIVTKEQFEEMKLEV